MRKIISIIDDDTVMLQFLGKILQSEQNEVQLFSSPRQFLADFEECVPDIIISDLLMPEMDGLDVLRRVRVTHSALPFIILTTEAKVQTAIQAMKEGVVDYITKPIDTQEFRLRIERAYEFGKLRQILQTNISSSRKIYSPSAIVGESKTAKKAREIALAAEAGPLRPHWFIGEKGVGKDFLAKTIHYAGSSAAYHYLELDCDTIVDDDEMERVLFGTIRNDQSCRTRTRGLIEKADNGTLVLRNPENLPESIQQKICSFMSTGAISPMGTSEKIPVAAMLICISTSEERYLTHLDNFDKEFLACFETRAHIMQPLRKRKEDVIPLADYYLSQESDSMFCYALTEDAKAKMLKYNWYANIDELVLTVQRAVLLCQDAAVTARDIITGYSAWTTSESDTFFQVPQGLHIKDVQGEYVRQTLEYFDGNLEKAAKSLGVSRKTLWEVRKKFNLP